MDIPRKRTRRLRPWILGTIGIAALAAASWSASRLGNAAPLVERAGLYFDTVRHGSMLRRVRGPGRLVPERIRWVTSRHSGRVEAIHVEPGAGVGADTVLLELSNDDIELASLQADMDLTEARAEFQNIKAKLESEQLAQQAVIADVQAQHRDAKQTEADDENLFRESIIAKIILRRSKNRVLDLAQRLGIERRRLLQQTESSKAQCAAQESRLEQLTAIQKFRKEQLRSLRVVAGTRGVCQELPVEIGQWVTPGTLLAKVVDPSKLKAELEIAELQAKEIRIGQKAVIDTRHGTVAGHVSRLDPSVRNGSVTIDVALDEELPSGSRPDQSIDGTVALEKLDDILLINRPVFGDAFETVGVFRIEADGQHARLVSVRFGKSSVKTIQVVEGLERGDRVILSDMTQWLADKRVRLD